MYSYKSQVLLASAGLAWGGWRLHWVLFWLHTACWPVISKKIHTMLSSSWQSEMFLRTKQIKTQTFRIFSLYFRGTCHGWRHHVHTFHQLSFWSYDGTFFVLKSIFVLKMHCVKMFLFKRDWFILSKFWDSKWFVWCFFNWNHKENKMCGSGTGVHI